MPKALIPSRRRTGRQTTPATWIASRSSTCTFSKPLIAHLLRSTARGRHSSRAQFLEHDRVDLLDPVHALLEVLGAGPGRERGLELTCVTERRQALPQL